MGELKSKKIVWATHAPPIVYLHDDDLLLPSPSYGSVRVTRAHTIIEGERLTLCGLFPPGYRNLLPLEDDPGVFDATPEDKECDRCYRIKTFARWFRNHE